MIKGLDEYQEKALSTCNDVCFNMDYLALGLNGEAGEVADKMKKILRDKGGEMTKDDEKEIALELGDVLWYVASFSKRIGFDLSDIANMNADKLESRQSRGKINGSGDNR